MWSRCLWGAGLGLLIGCSSASDAAPAATPDAGNGELRAEVLAACEGFAKRLCESSEPCCTEAYGKYDARAV